jgi:GNAT superfamily N-acetyltransferase
MLDPVIAVRDAEQHDSEVLGEIHAASWEAAYAPFFDPVFATDAVRDRRGRWRERIGQGPGTILIAEAGGRPAAFSFSVPSSVRRELAEIYSFYCHPDAWGAGVAVMLMTGTLHRLRDDGFAGVHLWTLRDTPRSRRFYTKSGFHETGAQRAHDFGDGNPLPQVEYEHALLTAAGSGSTSTEEPSNP